MAANLSTYDVFRSENRTAGDCQHLGTVDAVNEAAALDEAQGQYECDRIHHLWVAEQSDDD